MALLELKKQTITDLYTFSFIVFMCGSLTYDRMSWSNASILPFVFQMTTAQLNIVNTKLWQSVVDGRVK